MFLPLRSVHLSGMSPPQRCVHLNGGMSPLALELCVPNTADSRVVVQFPCMSCVVFVAPIAKHGHISAVSCRDAKRRESARFQLDRIDSLFKLRLI